MTNCNLFLGDFDLLKGKGDGHPENSYLNLFDLSFYKEIFDSKENTTTEEVISQIEAHAKKCDTLEKRQELLAAGVGLLNLFIQKNWTGPDPVENKRLSEMTDFDSRENILKKLVIDGESVFPLVELPEVFLLSKIILQTCESQFENIKIAKLWYIRCLFIHQQILEEFSEELFKRIDTTIHNIKENATDITEPELINYYLEFARVYMYFQRVQTSKSLVQDATELSGIQVSLTGAMGKRTRFQIEDLAQLILRIDVKGENTVLEMVDYSSSPALPKDVKLDDDIRLHKIKFAEGVNYKFPDLTELQQTVVLAILFQTEKSQPKDNLADEELHPLINCLIDKSKVWSLRMSTLLVRSKLEASHKRTVQRAMLQVQVLVESLSDPEVTLEERFHGFFTSHMVPKWDIQSTLGTIYLSMGSIKSALAVYESLNDLDNVIFCYNSLQLRHKAQEIIEQELKKNETPKLYCLLGDATDDVSCYEKAWVLSNEKSARAQRHWGYFYYYRKEYGKCMEHFKKSLELNSFQKEVWYRLGYCALVEEKWEVGARAYRRYCLLDPECFEAWNNLGRCYCEMKQKFRAWKALKEALKIDHSNWRVWDNYMLVSCDLRAFDEAVRSYHQVLNLKGKHIDLPLLNRLVVGLKTFSEEEENETGKIDKKYFGSKLLELFGRLSCQVINDPELWFLYSEIVDLDTPENILKKHQLLLKSYRSAINKPDCYSTIEKCSKLIVIVSKMTEAGLQTKKRDVLVSCQLAARGTATKIKKAYPDTNLCEELEESAKKLDVVLSKE